MLLAAKVIVAVMGLCFSLFYAWKATDIFVDTSHPFIKTKSELWCWWAHQRWLNFMGSGVGWAAVYYFIFFRLLPVSLFTFKIEDTILILVALLGVAGFLPNALSRVTSLKG